MIRKYFTLLSLLFSFIGLNIATAQSTKDDTSLIYPRKMVVEEWTGTWCGMCVRGIVGMEYMEEHYGNENFIGLAVHSNDRMEAPSYKGFIDNFIRTSFPGCIINRSIVGDPAPEPLQNNYNKMVGEKTYALVKASAVPPTSDQQEMEVSATLRFSRPLQDADLMLTFVLTENGVGPYPQYNTYSNGMLGPMGGWENKGGYVLTYYDHVVCQAVDCLGIPNSVPTTLEADFDYTYTCPISLENIKDINRTTLVAMLIDGTTNEIVNADKVQLQSAGVGATTLSPEPTIKAIPGGIAFEGDYREGSVYTPDGRCIRRLAGEQQITLPRGLYIVTLTTSRGTLQTSKIKI